MQWRPAQQTVNVDVNFWKEIFKSIINGSTFKNITAWIKRTLFYHEGFKFLKSEINFAICILPLTIKATQNFPVLIALIYMYGFHFLK